MIVYRKKEKQSKAKQSKAKKRKDHGSWLAVLLKDNGVRNSRGKGEKI